jgi:adenine-specific DNA methylase
LSGPTRRFIEESFPVREVSAESAREKNIRHGHISTLHIWWARRPLASSRATNYAALIPAPKNDEEWNKKRNFIINLCKWEAPKKRDLINQARKDILDAYAGVPPKLLDPFGGGGAIPLEALRLGCETYSNDLNPVAVLIQKCTLEYPQKYGAELLDDLEKWGNWVLEEAKKQLGEFYPKESDGSVPVAYIWARTIPCQNPSCRKDVPLVRQFWLAKKDKKKVAAYLIPTTSGVEFKIVGTGYDEWPEGFDPEKGTVARAVAVCPCCGASNDANTTRKLFKEGKSGQKMVAVVTRKEGEIGKRYRVANQSDLDIFNQAQDNLKIKRQRLIDEWGIDPVPDEPTPESKGNGADRAFSVRNYELNTWGDLFNSRQKLSLITFVEKVRQAHSEMIEQGYESEYAKAIDTYLGLLLSKMTDWVSCLTSWQPHVQCPGHTFTRQALGMVWDYCESVPITGSSGSWRSLLKVLFDAAKTFFVGNLGAVVDQASAASLQYPANYFDIVATDPPYYDNVPYSYLSDFFYVWLKRSIGHMYPDLFSTPLSPKKNEIVTYSEVPHGFKDGKDYFETMLKKAFQEIYRVLKPDGIAVIVYAHKSTSGWETLVNSLLDSGLIMTGAYPINTEMGARLRAQDSATLASSIYIVARKMERQSTGFYIDVKEELKKHLDTKLKRLWEEGIGGADFFIAAIGSAIEVFGKYEKVMDYEGNIIRADKLLDDVSEVATNYAVREILHNGFAGEISDLTRFYVLWRWNFGEAKVLFDDARRLAQSCSIELGTEWGKSGFILKEKEFIRVIGPDKRKQDSLGKSTELIDVLHNVLLLWEKSQRQELLQVLLDSGYGQSEAFYRVAQAISETLPIESKEKKLLDGFLSGKERVKEEMKNGKGKQDTLF